MGMWLNDQKEGPGKYIYRSRRQAFEGEWVKGMPKCGTMVDLPPQIKKTIENSERSTGSGIVGKTFDTPKRRHLIPEVGGFHMDFQLFDMRHAVNTIDVTVSSSDSLFPMMLLIRNVKGLLKVIFYSCFSLFNCFASNLHPISDHFIL